MLLKYIGPKKGGKTIQLPVPFVSLSDNQGEVVFSPPTFIAEIAQESGDKLLELAKETFVRPELMESIKWYNENGMKDKATKLLKDLEAKAEADKKAAQAEQDKKAEEARALLAQIEKEKEKAESADDSQPSGEDVPANFGKKSKKEK